MFHVALSRKRTEAMKIRIVGDMAQFEFALSRLVPLTPLAIFPQWKTFRQLLFADPESLSPTSPEIVDLPGKLILHYVFTLMPPQLSLPVAASDKSQYINWVLSNDSSVVCTALRQQFRDYQKIVHGRGDSFYPPPYSLIDQLVSLYAPTPKGAKS